MYQRAFHAIVVLTPLLGLCLGQVSPPGRELYDTYWNEIGAEDVASTIVKFTNLNTNKAKNVILFIGDGMSLATVVAGRMHKAQKRNPKAPGEETLTAIDVMPHSGLMKTYSVSHQTPDGAATATAFLCGIKTRSNKLGVTARAGSGNCAQIQRFASASVLENAIAVGKSTGIVTTSRIQDATPAAAYAKSPSRAWYSDVSLPKTARMQRCADISSQLVKNKKINVILGGGRAHMRPAGTPDEEFGASEQTGDRLDGRNLIEEWLSGKSRASYVWNKQEFDRIDPANTDYLMGLFNPYQLQYALNKHLDIAGEPSLPEMTQKAIQILQKNKKNGFFLLVESGLIDNGHHGALAHYAMEEFLQLEEAVQIAKNLTSESDTLIIVTGDHGHVFTIGGGGTVRGNPILGLSPRNSQPKKAKDGKYYTGASYANGPGGYSSRPRPKVTAAAAAEVSHKFHAGIPLRMETHSAEDVPAYSSGPMSHLITGVHEQNYIAHMINYASCTGPYEESTDPHCVKEIPKKSTGKVVQ